MFTPLLLQCIQGCDDHRVIVSQSQFACVRYQLFERGYDNEPFRRIV